ncbi:transformer-2 protein homolog alpha-like [Palaemon carinicauda]|uniref:transformer-2 protein homolog alpha-like n=1 Tax=Palaemon carinicauda TaxID=392227 RepID=UPI0035B67CE1
MVRLQTLPETIGLERDLNIFIERSKTEGVGDISHRILRQTRSLASSFQLSQQDKAKEFNVFLTGAAGNVRLNALDTGLIKRVFLFKRSHTYIKGGGGGEGGGGGRGEGGEGGGGGGGGGTKYPSSWLL